MPSVSLAPLLAAQTKLARDDRVACLVVLEAVDDFDALSELMLYTRELAVVGANCLMGGGERGCLGHRAVAVEISIPVSHRVH